MSPDSAGARRALLVPETASGRLDSFLSGFLPGVSRKRIKIAFREGRIRVDDRAARASDTAIPGTKVELVGLLGWEDAKPSGPASSHAAPKIEIVFQDEHLLVVEKPAGVPAYPLEPGEGGSVAESVAELFPDMAGVGDQPGAPGLCHRLDLETSGLLLFARSPEVFSDLRRQFRARIVTKVYLAVVEGLLHGEGVVDRPIGRRSTGRMVVEPSKSLRQWPALTRWVAKDHSESSSLLELELETGVTHQARVHMAWLGHPILGDVKYGADPAARLGLHAWRLGFTHPKGGARLALVSALDATLREMLLAR